MVGLIERLRTHAVARPRATAVAGGEAPGEVPLSYAALCAAIDALAPRLGVRSLGLLMDNGPAWVVADLAALAGGITCVPLPPFFSPLQLMHVVRDAGLEGLLADRPLPPALHEAVESEAGLEVAGAALNLYRLRPTAGTGRVSAVAKISYTSGSTGEPRGVCLARSALEHKTQALSRVTEAGPGDRSLCLTPLATLLENIGGVYVPLLAGGTCCVPPLQSVGLTGSSGLDAGRMLAAIRRHRPTSLITIPQTLRVLVEAAERGVRPPAGLRFVAVGGAPVPPALLERAAAMGLPVYQGYGLTEAVSVVALNTPARNRPGSVGRPLPGMTVRIADDGEIVVEGELFSGYLGHVTGHQWRFATGDLGRLDEDGYLYVTGRKKNTYATAFGRNVSPEWVEGELYAHPAIAQAVVFGEASPVNVAILVPAPGADEGGLRAAVAAANRRLPDYARVSGYVVAREPFSVANGQLTGTGRPRREIIARHYADALRDHLMEAV